jgi:hypothetical protein
VYPGLVIKSISHIDTKNSSVNINFTLILRINVNNIDPKIREYIKHHLSIRINDEARTEHKF